MVHHLVRLLVCAVLSCGVTTAWVRAQPADHPAEVELLADVSSIKPGQPFQVGICFKMQPGWHVYWLNPGDAGEPPQVKWTLPEGFTAGELRFPVPRRFDQAGDLVGYGYEDEVLLMATITPPGDLKVGDPLTMVADLTWLVCADVCLMGDAKREIELSVADMATPVNRELFGSWLAKMPQAPIEVGAKVSVGGDKQRGEIHVIVDWSAPAPAKVEWFPPPDSDVEWFVLAISSEGNRTTVVTRPKFFEGKVPPTTPLQSLLAYDAGDGIQRGLLASFTYPRSTAYLKPPVQPLPHSEGGSHE